MFLHFMNQMTLLKICRTVLVLLNITDDETYISMTKEEWSQHYEKVFQEMLGRKVPPPNVKMIYFREHSALKEQEKQRPNK